MGANNSDIGILVVAHGNLAAGLVSAAEEIMGPAEGLESLKIDASADPKTVLDDALARVAGRHGVLALTDLFGGTPSNITLALAADHDMEVVTGASLPMLLRALSRRDSASLKEVAADVAEYGRRQILTPNDLLSEKEAR